MRLAVLADVRGSPLALDAVLADAVAVGVEGYLVLGSVLS
jgi:hypothetical protein